MKPIRILVADDHAVIRDGFHTILSTDKDMEVTAVAKDGAEALEQLKQYAPDVALIDWDMPGMNGLKVMQKAIAEGIGSSFVILSSYHDDHLAIEAFKKGANGFLLKNKEAENIILTVKGCAKGKLIFPAESAAGLRRSLIIKHNNIFSSLSEAEDEVLACLAEGMKNKEIAETLYLSEGTVRNYISSLYKKLKVKTRSEAISLYKSRHY
ncbi:response regulator [Salimicrobium salexigens]|uniref:Two component transcriptional regulator, LuxR family n=1 Tax=Salimicrobium salexigens TaxID=908941 RepID=A0ABY1KWD6_9BACI|nr:response regulator transcription factor [Salimicrobium salexigens]SIS86053.1 two component transcriptional regulator, LuxR family [Salimicrobium salexigens]